MFRFFFFTLVVFFATTSFSQSINKSTVDTKGRKKLLGVVNKEGLTQAPFNDWFVKNYDDYLQNDKVIEQLKKSLKGYKITVFLGTWCGDSKREVPRFYRVLEAANFSKSNLKVIALDNETKMYKKSPGGEEKGLKIHRVPTFIFYKNDKEVNRIVERPKETLEKDILHITTGKKYTPNYVAVNYLNNLFQTKTLGEIESIEKELVPMVSQTVEGIRELNTYGSVLLRSNQKEKALFVLGLNAKIFPYHYYVYSSLGKAHFEIKNYTDALNYYQKSFAINSENKDTKLMIQKIEKFTKQ